MVNSVVARTNEHRVLALVHGDLCNSGAAGIFEGFQQHLVGLIRIFIGKREV